MTHLKSVSSSNIRELSDEGRRSRMIQQKIIPARHDFASVMEEAIIPLLESNKLNSQSSGANRQYFEQMLGDSIGLGNARTMATLSELLAGKNGDSTLETLRNVVTSRAVAATLSGQMDNGKSFSGQGSIRGNIDQNNFVASKNQALYKPMPSQKVDKNFTEQNSIRQKITDDILPGSLSARFESGKDGIAAIGYDKHGGTSYGKYQLSSRAGTMDQFIAFLKKESPKWSKELAKAGPANTGGKTGQMPKVWQKIAEENPEFFEKVQDKFIYNYHFEPALQAISEKTGINSENMSSALREVLWSTAVQHGVNGATRIFAQAVKKAGVNKQQIQAENTADEAAKQTPVGGSQVKAESQAQVRPQTQTEAQIQVTWPQVQKPFQAQNEIQGQIQTGFNVEFMEQTQRGVGNIAQGPGQILIGGQIQAKTIIGTPATTQPQAQIQVQAEIKVEAKTENYDKILIEKVYALRSTQFGSSEKRVQNAVQNRLKQEKNLALAMLEQAQS